MRSRLMHDRKKGRPDLGLYVALEPVSIRWKGRFSGLPPCLALLSPPGRGHAEVLAASLAGAVLLTDTLHATSLTEGYGRRWIHGRALKVKSLSVASVSPSPSGRIKLASELVTWIQTIALTGHDARK